MPSRLIDYLVAYNIKRHLNSHDSLGQDRAIVIHQIIHPSHRHQKVFIVAFGFRKVHRRL
jgi:hypothetical protein